MAAMVNRGILNFLNQLDEGKRSRRNSFAERVANFLTPNDEFEYRGGLLSNMDGTSAMDRIGEKTSYGTLGQANFAGNDPIKDGLLSKMTSAPPKLRPLGLLNKGQPEVVNDMMPGENTFAYTEPAMPNPLAGEVIKQTGSLYTPEKQEDLEFVEFLTQYKDDPLFADMINDQPRMREIFKIMKQNLAQSGYN